MSNQKKSGEPQKAVVTHYDQKLEKRKLKAEKETRTMKLYSLAFAAVVLAVAVAAVGAATVPMWNRHKALNDTYVTIGGHSLSPLEYQYYYQTARNSFQNTYGSMLSYMGWDPSRADKDQIYMDNMTWKDSFDQQAVAQVSSTKALVDEANANGFTADLEGQYDEFLANTASLAATAQLTEADYFKASFGTYATKANIEPFVRENLLAQAYYDELLKQKAPTAEAITVHYEANKNDYDKVDYRSFAFNAELADDATEEQVAAAMAELTGKAEAMAASRKEGQDFKALCLEHAAEADKATYQDEVSDASLTEGAAYVSLQGAYREWLFDGARQAGDITVAADEANHRVYVVEFEARNYDDTTETAISETLAGQAVTEYLAGLAANYTVTDVAGDLDYLKLSAAGTEAAGAPEGGTENETAEAGGAAETSVSEAGAAGGAAETSASEAGAAKGAAEASASEAGAAGDAVETSETAAGTP